MLASARSRIAYTFSKRTFEHRARGDALDVQLNLLDRHVRTSPQLEEVREARLERKVRFEVLDVELDLIHMKVRHAEVDVGFAALPARGGRPLWFGARAIAAVRVCGRTRHGAPASGQLILEAATSVRNRQNRSVHRRA
jgi:hypothetical protein